MKLNIDSKKIASLLIAGGITLSTTTLDAKAPTTYDTIKMIIIDNLNEAYGEDIIKDRNVDVTYNERFNTVSFSYCNRKSPFYLPGPYLSGEEEARALANIDKDIYNFIGAPNYSYYDNKKLIWEKKKVPIYYTSTSANGETVKVMVGFEEKEIIVDLEENYTNSSTIEYFDTKNPKVKQK